MSLTFSAIYNVVKQIPRGKVATYGQVALLAGDPKGARTVGWALHANPSPGKIPCFRVVDRYGHVSSAFAFGGGNRQIQLLAKEGVPCGEDGCVNLSLYQWNPYEDRKD